jgi:formylglycine-generating enzyme required for sulfatase activity
MRTKCVAVFAAMIVVNVLALTSGASAADTLSGTWMLDVTKSTYSPGPAPKSNTVKVESNEKEFKVDAKGTDAEGKETHVHYEAKFDGKDYPVSGIAFADMVSVKRIDANTVESTMKKGGQVMMTVTTTVSADGKTRTTTFKGKNEKGQDVNNVAVYEKQ